MAEIKYKITTPEGEDIGKANSADGVRDTVVAYCKALLNRKRVPILPHELVHLDVLNFLCQEKITFLREGLDGDWTLYRFVDGEFGYIYFCVCEM